VKKRKGIRKKQGKARIVRRRYRMSPYVLTPAARAFRTFEHDFQTVLEASVRAGARSPAAIVRDAELAADRMGEVVAARRPKSAELLGFHYRRHPNSRRQWAHFFDRLVHAMAERTSLSASQVVSRSERIADLATEVLRRRRRAS